MIAGVDEVGRGPLVGPVVVAAVILNPERRIEGLADSKTLSESKRRALYDEIIEKAEAYSVQSLSAAEVDRLNILQATFEGMRRSVLALPVQPTHVLIDGNKVPPGLAIPAEAVVKGDQKKASISAASILAKVTRDDWCMGYHEHFPAYGFDRHKGYPTAEHLAMLREYGPTPEHRVSFKPVAQYSLF